MADEQSNTEKGAIVGHVDNLFNEFDTARKERETTMMECYWNNLNQYSPAIQGQWRQREASGKGSQIFMGITNDKVRGGYSQVSDALVGMEFDVEPVETDAAKVDAADDRLLKHKQEIEKFIKLGEFGQVLNRQAYSGAWAGTGFVRAPVLAESVTLVYVEDEETQSLKGVREAEEYPAARNIDPFTVYPDPKGNGLQDGRGLIILHDLDAAGLTKEARALGWDMDAVQELLKTDGGSTRDGESWRSTKDSAKGEQSAENKGERYGVKEFWGPAKVEDLKEYGVDFEGVDVGYGFEDHDYLECCLVTSDAVVLKAILNPWYPAPYRPFVSWQWDLLPSSQWGLGVAEEIIPQQKMINGAYRLFIDNKALANNPMFNIYPDRLKPGQDLTSVFPGKKWVMKEGATGPGIEAVVIPDLSDNVLTLARTMQQAAENNTGVTFIAANSSDTATEAAINQNKLTSINRSRLRRLDEQVEQILEWYSRWINEFGDNDEAKIPVVIKATGILKTALVRELQTLRLQQMIPALQLAMSLPKQGPEGSALEGFDLTRFFNHLFRAMGIEDIALTEKEAEAIELEKLGELGALLRQAIDGGGDIQSALASIVGGVQGVGGDINQAAQDAGSSGDVRANAGTAAQLTGGIGNLQAGAVNGVAG